MSAKLSNHDLRITLYGIVLSAFLAILKAITGAVGHSYALVADAIESTTDVFSSSLLLLGVWFARRPADDHHPYGHGRAEILATFMVVAFLIASASIIMMESIQHILTPHKTPAPFTLLVLLLVVCIKEALARILLRHSQEGSALAAESWHHRSDAITSLAAFLGISISLWMGEGWESADDWAAIVAALIIYYNAWLIFRPALADMMDEDRFDDLRQMIIQQILQEKNVLAVEECLLRKLGSQYSVDLRLAVAANSLVCEMHNMNKRIKQHLKESHPNLERIFIELKPQR